MGKKFVIYTGYHAKASCYQEQGFKVISISRIKPAWIDKELLKLAPSKKLLFAYKAKSLDEQDYTKLFYKEKKSINLCKIVKKLKKYEKVVLTCFCGRDTFCHRHLIAKMLKENCNIIIREFKC